MEVEIRGNEIFSDKDFHNQLAKALNVEQYYGKNLDALWGLLSFNIERPLIIIWQNSDISKHNIGEDFEKITDVLQRVKDHDEKLDWQQKFDFILQ
ncbi:barnase inhibitor [Moraxella osloensis]|nr:barstar family protein [Moraxella osloensis]MBW4019397.1 barnase inhibitor [Moraxella osloensis]